MSTKVISYKGKTLNTKHHVELSDEHHQKIIDDYYTQPSMNEVEYEIKKLHNCGVKTTNIIRYFLKD